MCEETHCDRRRFLGTAAMTMAAARLGLIGAADAQAGTTTPADLPAITPGTHTSFGALKQIDAGVLQVGYAEAGPADGPAYDALEQRLAQGPVIAVPTITLEGDANGAPHPEARAYAKTFSGPYAHRVLTGGIGHNPPQEAPQAFAQAVLDVDRY